MSDRQNKYPTGIELIMAGKCPRGAMSPAACMVCPTGHTLECHYPYDCHTAECAHSEEWE